MHAKIKHQLGLINIEVPLNVISRFDIWIKLNVGKRKKFKIYEIKIEYRPPDNIDFKLCFEEGWKEIFKSCEKLGKEHDVEMLVFFTKFFPDRIKYNSKLPYSPFKENSILDQIDKLFFEIQHVIQYCFKKCKRERFEIPIFIFISEQCIAECLESHKFII